MTLKVKGHDKKSVDEIFIVRDRLQSMTPYVKSELAIRLQQHNHRLAESRHYGKPTEDTIDILIGTNIMAKFIKLEAPQKLHSSIAMNTIFGWCIFGTNKVSAQVMSANTTVLEQEEISSLDRHFAAFWQLEHMGISSTEATQSEFTQAYINTIDQHEDGSAVVLYPYRTSKPQFDSCEDIAKIRLTQLLQSKKFTPDIRRAYHAELMTYKDAGYIEPAKVDYDGPMAYLPHRPVVREQAESTKVRPVFDGSVHRKGRLSFNANLEVGPNLNPDIMGILMLFRRYPIAWTADIQKAFLQIRIAGPHKQIVRFIWVDDPSKEEPERITYVWTRLCFGLTSSPFIL